MSDKRGEFQADLAVKDDKGISELHNQSYPVEIPNEMIEQAAGKEIGYTVTLEVRPGQPTVSAGVWDAISGLESFVLMPVKVGEKG